MKIKFDVSSTNIGKTDCPYGVYGFAGTILKVGGFACINCIHFVSVDLEKREVECDYDGHKRGD